MTWTRDMRGLSVSQSNSPLKDLGGLVTDGQFPEGTTVLFDWGPNVPEVWKVSVLMVSVIAWACSGSTGARLRPVTRVSSSWWKVWAGNLKISLLIGTENDILEVPSGPVLEAITDGDECLIKEGQQILALIINVRVTVSRYFQSRLPLNINSSWGEPETSRLHNCLWQNSR